VLYPSWSELEKEPRNRRVFQLLRAPHRGKRPPRSYGVGVMFWLRRNWLVGSYLFLSATSLSYFSGP
jgi:hypothetical protein